MALSGSFTGTTANEYIVPKIIWSATQSVSGNYSMVTAELRYSRTNSYTTYGDWYGSITINGTKVPSTQVDSDGWIYISISKDSNTLAMKTPAVKVPHNNDGTKSITISATGNISGTTLTSTSISSTITLNTIPRASSITSAAAVTLGNKCSVKWTPLATGFAYKLNFTSGGVSHTTDYISPGSTSAYTYTGYTMEVSKWAAAMPKTYSATCTVTLYTYQNSSSSSPIGSASATFTLTLNPIYPTISFTTSSGVNTWTAGDGNIYYLQSISSYKIAATFTASTGSYISSCSISGTGLSLSATGSTSTTSKSLSGTTSILSKSGSHTYTAQVTDGRTIVSAIKSITVYAYAKPVLSLSATRSSNSGAVNFAYSASCSNVNSQNLLKTLSIYKRTPSETAWTLAHTIALDTMSTNSSVTILGFDTTSSYELRATVTDTYGSSSEAVASISSKFKLINMRKNVDGTNGGVSIGKISEEYIFDCALPARFLQNIEFGPDIQGNLTTNNTMADDGTVRNVVYLQTGQNVDGGATMGLALHNASVYIENSANSGKINLGSNGRKWNQLYAANSTISTSDRTVKTDITNMSDAQEQLFSKLQPVTFKFVNGSSGRTHYGFVSQDVEKALEELDLTGQDFAGFCKDLQFNDDGEIATNEDGSKKYNYSLRYSEFIALNTYMIQKLQLENQELRNELQALKEILISNNASSNNVE